MIGRATDVVLSSVRWQFKLVYLNNIIVFSKASRDYNEHIWRLQQLLYETGATVNLHERNFCSETTAYLGHVIWPGHLELAEHTANGVAKT